MAQQYWVQLEASEVVDQTAVVNTTSETILVTDKTVPANFLRGDRILRGKLFGKLSTTGTPTVTFRVRLGGVSGFDAPAASAAVDLTVDKALSVTVQWSAASASNTIQVMHYTVESLS